MGVRTIPGFISDSQYFTAIPIKAIKKHQIFESLFPREEKDIQLLQEAIKKDGMLEPLVVLKQGSEFILIDGYTRYEALKRIGEDKATAIVIENIDLGKEENLMLLKQLALSANAVRRHLKPEQLMEIIEELDELRSKAKDSKLSSKIDIVENTYENIVRQNYNTSMEVIDYIVAESKKYPGFFRAMQIAFNDTEKFPYRMNEARRLLSFFSEDVKQAITAKQADLVLFVVSHYSTIEKNEEYRKALRDAKTVADLERVVTGIKKHLEGKIVERRKPSGQRINEQREKDKKTNDMKKDGKIDTPNIPDSARVTEDVKKKENTKTINVNITINNQVPTSTSENDKMKNLELIEKGYLSKFIEEIEEEARQHEVYLHEYLLKAIIPVIQKEAPDAIPNLKPISKNEGKNSLVERELRRTPS